jgi:hypothetical protein
MRKLLQLGGLFLLLAILSLRPAAAVYPCECDFCATHPSAPCIGGNEVMDFAGLCRDYYANPLFCPVE